MREPTKAIREQLESDDGTGFDYFLCEKLGWRSVALMRRGMSAREHRSWWIWYAIKQQARELEMERRS